MHFPDPNKLHCFQLTVTPGNILTYFSVAMVFKRQILKAAQTFNLRPHLSSNFLKVAVVMTIPYEDKKHALQSYKA